MACCGVRRYGAVDVIFTLPSDFCVCNPVPGDGDGYGTTGSAASGDQDETGASLTVRVACISACLLAPDTVCCRLCDLSPPILLLLPVSIACSGRGADCKVTSDAIRDRRSRILCVSLWRGWSLSVPSVTQRVVKRESLARVRVFKYFPLGHPFSSLLSRTPAVEPTSDKNMRFV